jgi:1,4-dihydroxy-2-naphthoate polyprenyltransferase
MMVLKSWLLASRPKTLTAAVVPILVGTSLAATQGQSLQLWISCIALISALFIQTGTNFVNDAADFEKGADTPDRLGPQRVTQSGVFSAHQVWTAAGICFLASAVLAIPLLIQGGWPIFWIGVVSILCGYAYTAGPYPLAYLGLGDLFVLLFFGWVAVSGIYFLNTGRLEDPVWIAGSQVGLLATVLIAINNLRDCSTDRVANKRTLPVRFGVLFARMEILFLCLTPFLGCMYWYQHGLVWASLLPLCTLPLAVRLTWKIFTTRPGKIYNQFLAQGALLHLSFGILLSLGFWLK